MSEELEYRVKELEKRIFDVNRRLEDTVLQTLANNRDISSLSQKIDAMREDLREIKKMGEAFVPRREIEARLDGESKKISELEKQMLNVIKEIGNNQVSVTKEIAKNTMATYGTLISLLLSLALMFGNQFFGRLGKM